MATTMVCSKILLKEEMKMATNKSFSFAALAQYCNSSAGSATTFKEAFKQDAKKFYAKAGYPSKDEIDILDDIDPDVTNTVTQIPQLVSGFMKDEQRSFDLPAPDENTAPATINVVHVEEKTTEGVVTIEGPTKGEKWTSTIAEHDEPKLKVRRNKFKK